MRLKALSEVSADNIALAIENIFHFLRLSQSNLWKHPYLICLKDIKNMETSLRNF